MGQGVPTAGLPGNSALGGIDLQSLGLGHLLGQMGGVGAPTPTAPAAVPQDQMNTANLLKGIPGIPDNFLSQLQNSAGSTAQGTAGKVSASSGEPT